MNEKPPNSRQKDSVEPPGRSMINLWLGDRQADGAGAAQDRRRATGLSSDRVI